MEARVEQTEGAPIEVRLEDVDEMPIVWRHAPGGDPPILYVHGVPESGAMWEPFLARTGGLAPDLPGFGGSAKRGDFRYDVEGYADWLERFLAHVEVDRFRLVLHDWGAVALALAQRAPERVERLVIVNAVPFLPGYRWHRVARWWRRPVAGELMMGATTRWALRRSAEVPREIADRWWEDFDQGTQRAILKLYRSAPEDRLATLGAGLDRIACPTLVVWGERDRYLDPSFADAYAQRIAGASVRRAPGAGHWPWLDDAGVTDEVCRFLLTGDTP